LLFRELTALPADPVAVGLASRTPSAGVSHSAYPHFIPWRWLCGLEVDKSPVQTDWFCRRTFLATHRRRGPTCRSGRLFSAIHQTCC